MANSYSNSNGQMSKWVHCKVRKGLGWLVWLVRVLNLVPGVLLSFLCAHDQITKLISCLSFQFLNRNNASACHQEKTCRRPIQKNKIGVLLHLYLQWHVADWIYFWVVSTGSVWRGCTHFHIDCIETWDSPGLIFLSCSIYPFCATPLQNSTAVHCFATVWRDGLEKILEREHFWKYSILLAQSYLNVWLQHGFFSVFRANQWYNISWCWRHVLDMTFYSCLMHLLVWLVIYGQTPESCGKKIYDRKEMGNYESTNLAANSEQ